MTTFKALPGSFERAEAWLHDVQYKPGSLLYLQPGHSPHGGITYHLAYLQFYQDDRLESYLSPPLDAHLLATMTHHEFLEWVASTLRRAELALLRQFLRVNGVTYFTVPEEAV